MLFKKNLLLIAFIGAFSFLQAQPNSTGKMALLKKYELQGAEASADKLEITITKNGDNITVTTKGIKSTGVKGCDNCNVSGKITFAGGAEPFKRGSKITFPPNALQAEKTGTLNADGSFSFTGVPKGTRSLVVDGVVLVTGWKIGGE